MSDGVEPIIRDVGGSGLHRIDWSVPRFEIGYWVRTGQAGRGYATEAARRIGEFAFETLDAEGVEIWCDVRNERSAAVARRAGSPLSSEWHARAVTAPGGCLTRCASSGSGPEPLRI